MSAICLSKTGNECVQQVCSRSEEMSGMVLCRGQVRTLRGIHVGKGIHVFKGAVWITQTDDIRDVIVPAGETFRITRPGDVVLQGITPLPCVIEIEA